MTTASLRAIPLLLLLSSAALAQPLEQPAVAATQAQRDLRVREYVSAKRIVWKSDATGAYVTNADHLLKPGTGQAELFAKNVTALKSDSQHTAAVLLDFGREIHGGVSLVTGMWESKKPVRVRIRFGESASEAMAELDGLTGATNDHAIRDYTVALPWLGQIDIGLTGFRFVRIDLLDPAPSCSSRRCSAVFVFRDLAYAGLFPQQR